MSVWEAVLHFGAVGGACRWDRQRRYCSAAISAVLSPEQSKSDSSFESLSMRQTPPDSVYNLYSEWLKSVKYKKLVLFLAKNWHDYIFYRKFARVPRKRRSPHPRCDLFIPINCPTRNGQAGGRASLSPRTPFLWSRLYNIGKISVFLEFDWQWAFRGKRYLQ